jgi:aspartyl-tRNA(Asn)/glutamyl-tRNA(Gln) amidotransferase subunit B
MTLAYDDVVARYEPVIGLETHVELGTVSKMFCGCATDFGAAPNTHTCPVCLGLPGALPVVNEAAIESTIRIGLALNCSIAPWCRFARKNYFYPDMPKNYQISQYDEPLCVDGYLDVTVGEVVVRVGIERVHMEEDTGKNTHVGGATGRIHGAEYSLVDFNRAGIPLIEIVTRPVPGTGRLAPEVAKAYVTELRDILRTLGVSDVRMEQGSLRCDVNTSLNPPGAAEWGTRTETKNVNSLRSVERAVRSELIRQAAVLDAGQRVYQETRHFSESTGDTRAGRSKEEATDYRYFPEPDLVPVAADPAWVARLRDELPELPAARRVRWRESLGVSAEDMRRMTNAGVVDLVGATVEAGAAVGEARNWWLGYLAQEANAREVDAAELAITPAHVARVIELVGAGSLSVGLARQVVDGLLATADADRRAGLATAGAGTSSPRSAREDIDAVIAERGLRRVSDPGALEQAADAAIAANPDVADKVRGGKLPAVGALVGAVMQATRGQADAAAVRAILLDRLGVSE